MEAYYLSQQNFAVAESLLQLHQLFGELQQSELSQELRLAICAQWSAPDNAAVQHLSNQRVSVLARHTAQIPPSLSIQGGLDFLLRQAVIVACTSVESYFWDVLRENVLAVVRARRARAPGKRLLEIKIALGDYMSTEQYEDPDYRLKELILKKFERGTLYNTESIDEITEILTVKNFWSEVESVCSLKAADLRTSVGELIQRRNQIAHRADRPADEQDEADGHGLRPITYAWTNAHVQQAKTLVSAAHEVIGRAIERLEADVQAAQEQKEARRLARESSGS